MWNRKRRATAKHATKAPSDVRLRFADTRQNRIDFLGPKSLPKAAIETKSSLEAK